MNELTSKRWEGRVSSSSSSTKTKECKWHGLLDLWYHVLSWFYGEDVDETAAKKHYLELCDLSNEESKGLWKCICFGWVGGSQSGRKSVVKKI